jgi:hypothetical protein
MSKGGLIHMKKRMSKVYREIKKGYENKFNFGFPSNMWTLKLLHWIYLWKLSGRTSTTWKIVRFIFHSKTQRVLIQNVVMLNRFDCFAQKTCDKENSVTQMSKNTPWRLRCWGGRVTTDLSICFAREMEFIFFYINSDNVQNELRCYINFCGGVLASRKNMRWPRVVSAVA